MTSLQFSRRCGVDEKRTILFGTGGVPKSSAVRSSVAGIERLRQLGLDAMELEFVRGTFPGVATADAIACAAHDNGIVLTAHAPYFVNLNSHETDKQDASRKRIINTVRIGSRCGAVSIAFHPGSYVDDSPQVALGTIGMQLGRVLADLGSDAEGIDIRPETTGKLSQVGGFDEVLTLAEIFPSVQLCLDWAHLFVREEWKDTAARVHRILDEINTRLGESALQRLHMHISGIIGDKGGERKHVALEASRFDWRTVLSVLRERGAGGVLICESPELEDDARVLRDQYNAPREV